VQPPPAELPPEQVPATLPLRQLDGAPLTVKSSILGARYLCFLSMPAFLLKISPSLKLYLHNYTTFLGYESRYLKPFLTAAFTVLKNKRHFYTNIIVYAGVILGVKLVFSSRLSYNEKQARYQSLSANKNKYAKYA
jgi:hypothetical protein